MRRKDPKGTVKPGKRVKYQEKEKVPRSLQYPERLSENAKFKAGSQVDSIQWRKLFMSECAFVKEVYLTPLCLRSALDPKVASAVRANFSREKFKGLYEAERSDLVSDLQVKSLYVIHSF